MGFWDTDDGETIGNDGTFESGGGQFDPLPAGTSVLAAIETAEWTEHQGQEYISLQWTVLKPEEYKNRKIFQKLRVLDEDSKKKDKALRMLAAIDTNASKGKLLGLEDMPTDIQLAKALTAKQMVISLQIWKMDDKTGNWINKVAPKTEALKSKKAEPASSDALDDEIPF